MREIWNIIQIHNASPIMPPGKDSHESWFIMAPYGKSHHPTWEWRGEARHRLLDAQGTSTLPGLNAAVSSRHLYKYLLRYEEM